MIISQSHEQLLKQGVNSLKHGALDQAIAISKQLNETFPNYANGWYFTYQTALAINNQKAALQSIKNANKISPNNIGWQLTQANIHIQLKQYNLAERCLLAISEHQLNNVQEQQLAQLFSQLGQSDLALKYYQQAIEKAPNNGDYYYNLATELRFRGDKVSAVSALRKAIELNSLDIDAYSLLVDVEKQTNDHNHANSLKSLLTEKISPKQQIQVLFSLAKCYEDLQHYSTSFDYLAQATALRRKHLKYDINQDLHVMKVIAQELSIDWWRKTQPAMTNLDAQITPIFIVGMPRTGSTLVEQILAADDSVFAGGELNIFSSLLTERVIAQFGHPKSQQALISNTAKIDYQGLGAEYLKIISQRIPEQQLGSVKFITDKLPLNFLYLGLIKKALPQAKIIHVNRAPIDTCYAIFKTLFQQVYPFSYEQTELAKYFLSYQQLMSHWQTLASHMFYDVHYEQLVCEPEKTSADMFNYCQLNWQASYVNTRAQNNNIKTASASQVSEPIYQHSVEKWRHYQSELAPMINILNSTDNLFDLA
ncbi:tetratricopeptide repeat-containing sulfotransferase family protein [Colwellia sp. MEBiC06753]